MRLKLEHLNIANFEPEYGLNPMFHFALVGSEWQVRIQGRASNWQDKLVVTSTLSVEPVAFPNDYLVGMESRIEELEKLLMFRSINVVRVVGFSRMGGIGETTLCMKESIISIMFIVLLTLWVKFISFSTHQVYKNNCLLSA